MHTSPSAPSRSLPKETVYNPSRAARVKAEVCKANTTKYILRYTVFPSPYRTFTLHNIRRIHMANKPIEYNIDSKNELCG